MFAVHHNVVYGVTVRHQKKVVYQYALQRSITCIIAPSKALSRWMEPRKDLFRDLGLLLSEAEASEFEVIRSLGFVEGWEGALSAAMSNCLIIRSSAVQPGHSVRPFDPP